MSKSKEKPLLVTCFTNPDLDGFACVVGYTELLKTQEYKATEGIFGELHEEVKYLIETYQLSYPQKIDNPKSFDQVVYVDASNLNGLPEGVDPLKVVEIVDHRKVNDTEAFKNAEIQNEPVGAAATLITEKFKQTGVVPSHQSAVLLYGAIISNTLNFQANVTTQRDRDMAAWLNGIFQPPANFPEKMFLAKSDLKGEKLKERLWGDFAWFTFGNKKVGTAQIEMIGGKDLVEKRKEEILKELAKIKQEKGLDINYLSLIELNEGCNYFVTDEAYTQEILRSLFNVEFKDDVARKPGLIMRKEIGPLLKEVLETA